MIHEMGLLNGFDSPLRTRGAFVEVRCGLPASYHCIMVPGAYLEILGYMECFLAPRGRGLRRAINQAGAEVCQ